MFRFWEGSDRRWSPTLSVRVGPESIGFGAGGLIPPDRLQRFRAAVDADGERLAKAIGRLVRWQSAELIGPELKRVPAPFDAGHPHADLLRRKSLQVRWTADPKASVSKRSFVTFCRKQLEKATDVHLWLTEHMT